MRLHWDVHIDMGNYIYQGTGLNEWKSIYLNYANKEQWNQFVGIQWEGERAKVISKGNCHLMKINDGL